MCIRPRMCAKNLCMKPTISYERKYKAIVMPNSGIIRQISVFRCIHTYIHTHAYDHIKLSLCHLFWLKIVAGVALAIMALICMYVCMYVCMHVCIHTHTHTYIHVSRFLSFFCLKIVAGVALAIMALICMYVCMYVCMYTHIHTHIHTCDSISVFFLLQNRCRRGSGHHGALMYMYTYIHTYI
jgi:hypothetical protein